jgi:hypothetical protein
MARVRTSHLVALSGLLLIGAVVATSLLLLSNLRKSTLADNSRELSNIVLMLSEKTERAIHAVEVIEDDLIERIQARGVSTPENYERLMSGQENHLFLKEKAKTRSHIGSLTLINSEGKLFNFSRFWPLPKIDVTDREFFKVLRSDAKLNSFMGEPVENRATGTWTIHLVRKVAGPTGEFLGLILGAMDMQYFEQYFGTLNLDQKSTISLFRADGTLLASHPSPDPARARSYAADVGLMDVLNATKRNVILRKSLVENVEHLIVARRLENYPFILVARTPVAATLAGWMYELQSAILIVAFLLLTIGGAVFASVTQLRAKPIAAG